LNNPDVDEDFYQTPVNEEQSSLEAARKLSSRDSSPHIYNNDTRSNFGKVS
jgi:hypothetical protein